VGAAITLVVVGAGIALSLAPGDERVTPSLVEPASEHAPPFSFAVVHTGALPTAQLKVRKAVRTDPVLKLRGPSQVASTQAIASVTRLYRGAFLDPAAWGSGAYASLWRDFTPAARTQARKDVRVLTAGTAAGEAYVAIAPRPSRITTTVLLDRNGRPAIVVASARFRALGTTIAGRPFRSSRTVVVILEGRGAIAT